jgi:hypothetical protein
VRIPDSGLALAARRAAHARRREAFCRHAPRGKVSKSHAKIET